ncbi:hypothetical protein HHI36_003294 [Cryptolaemus montrouzieri]|uniref:Transposase Tc1-like domain-containing protein n=1 Tax=Cryptolaemus montrouzieri TaxID=559131 RepID=A0ABD2PD04_9CUCU
MLQNELALSRNVHISLHTVRNRLREDDIRPRVASIGPRLTREHRVARLQFAREHANWGISEWSNDLFSDESRFCLVSNDRRMPVYGRPGERYQQCNIRQTENFGGGSVVMWGGIYFHGRTELVLVNNRRMTAARYIADILELHVVPFGALIGENFIYMHDNAQPHAARVVTEFLQNAEIDILR